MNNNIYINWTDKNDTGIKIIDEQHKGVVSLINSLHFSILEKDSEKITAPIAQSIDLYTVIHFKTEQYLLEKAEYKDISGHISIHNDFINSMKRNMSEIEPAELLRFLKDWWLNHINVEDKKYVPHLLDYLKIE